MATGDVAGSWFNSGFHGHFRSKSRLDFLNEFRQLAKPKPPSKFVNRSHHRPAQHAFSHHDNRHSFQDSALYFEEGLGKRRIITNNTKGQPKLLAWVPHKKELEKQGVISSVYRVDFSGTPRHQKVTQRLIERPKTSFDDRSSNTTSYRYAHGGDNPNRILLTAMSNDGLTTTLTSKNRAKSAVRDAGSVASCMNWYQPHPPTRPNIAQATNLFSAEPATSIHMSEPPPQPTVKAVETE